MQTPVASAQAGTSRAIIRPHRDFLENTMGRSDLADLADLFAAETQQWAFIGSVAMQIHGHDLNSETAKNWQPGDADVLTNENGLLSICEKPVASANPDEPAKSRGTTFKFTETLNVDVVAASRTDNRFRGLETDTVYIKSTPVLSIAALIRLKESALRFAQSNNASDAVKRGEDNLKVLNKLKELSDARTSKASPGNVQAQSETPSGSDAALLSSPTTDNLSADRPSARKGRRLNFSCFSAQKSPGSD
ncbi:hypothetical protein [Actimicrobium antarcticum]|uniref:hypothetical protein n=1 Tax=Actimicrobium antarcticum TaxID=1051899 RepID=UPI0031DDD23F